MFSPVIFTLDSDFFPSSSTLTVTSTSAVPEPATWLMLIVGLAWLERPCGAAAPQKAIICG